MTERGRIFSNNNIFRDLRSFQVNLNIFKINYIKTINLKKIKYIRAVKRLKIYIFSSLSVILTLLIIPVVTFQKFQESVRSFYKCIW